ncbi:MAG: DUF3667 domain-containing protein [Flavobacterium sp.]|nr:MAG: DUF3667 domain-containing protein [Flavobacterium sp.]
MEAICRNCDTAYVAEYKFCPSCGQKANLHRLSLHEVFHEAIHYFTHADKGIFQLLRDLATRSGFVAREYVDGKRKKYFPPLNFYLLVAAIHVSTATVFEKTNDHVGKTAGAAAGDAQALRMERLAQATHFLNHYGNFTAMIILPFTALVLYLFYRKARFNYTEHLVACMYMAGFCTLIYAIIILPAVSLLKIPGIYGAAAFFILQIVYFSRFYCRFLDKSTWKQQLKAIVASFFAVGWWFAFSFLMIVVYMSTGFWGILG